MSKKINFYIHPGYGKTGQKADKYDDLIKKEKHLFAERVKQLLDEGNNDLQRTKDRILIIDNNEIEDAFWVSKEDLKLVLNGKADNFIPARKGTIARYLLEKWVNDEM